MNAAAQAAMRTTTTGTVSEDPADPNADPAPHAAMRKTPNRIQLDQSMCPIAIPFTSCPAHRDAAHVSRPHHLRPPRSPPSLSITTPTAGQSQEQLLLGAPTRSEPSTINSRTHGLIRRGAPHVPAVCVVAYGSSRVLARCSVLGRYRANRPPRAPLTPKRKQHNRCP